MNTTAILAAKPATHFNIEIIKIYVGSDKETINDILSLTITELNLALNKIELCLKNSNLTGIKDISHKLFGTAATLGLEKLSILAREFDSLTQINKLLHDLIVKMKEEINLVVNLIHKEIN